LKRIARPEKAPAESFSEERLQGTDIVEEILHNSEQGQFEFAERVIVPAVYHIYLHPEDLDRLKPVERVIREECKNSLNKRLRQLNRKRFGRTPVQYGIQAQDWEIQVLGDYHEDAAPGSVKVVSSLAPAEESDLVGTVTVRVKRKPPAKALAEAAAASAHAAPPAGDTRETNGAHETRKTYDHAASESPQVWGTVAWRDDEGDKVFSLRTQTAAVGRGSQMDVMIRNASEDVSRRHCVLRLDAAGKAWIRDAGSSNGTLLDGVALTPNTDTELPHAARVSMANGVVMMTFNRRGV
jgi:hypothetical protein